MSVLENSKTSPDVSGQSGDVALFWIRDVSTEFKKIYAVISFKSDFNSA
jgi:hypothetical protein